MDYTGPLAQRCFAGYAPLGQPARDVLQVGLLCGPAAGLKALPIAEHTGPGVFHQAWDAGAGDCFRVVVAADAAKPALNVRLTSSSPALGSGEPKYVRGAHGLLVVAPGAAELCVSAPGLVSLDVESGRAQRVVFQAWRR